MNKVHYQALEAAKTQGLVVISVAGDDYHPHLTLGIFDQVPSLPLEALSKAFPSDTPGRLALGELGPYGTFPRIIETAL